MENAEQPKPLQELVVECPICAGYGSLWYNVENLRDEIIGYAREECTGCDGAGELFATDPELSELIAIAQIMFPPDDGK